MKSTEDQELRTSQRAGRVLAGREGDVALKVISAPGRLNAFTRAMRADIVQTLCKIESEADLVGAIITGDGNAFCAGQDFNEVRAWTGDTPWLAEFRAYVEALSAFPKPLVAAFNGVATGGGSQSALMCDGRIAHAGVGMGQPEVRSDLASVIDTWLLNRSVGAVRARELVLSGRLMKVAELVKLGFVDRVVSKGSVVSVAIDKCREFAGNPAESFARTKRWLYESSRVELEEVCEDATRRFRAAESGRTARP